MKKIITKEESLMLQGLMLLSKRKMDEIQELINESARLLDTYHEDEDYQGHISDAMYGQGNYNISSLLKNMKIKVQPYNHNIPNDIGGEQ